MDKHTQNDSEYGSPKYWMSLEQWREDPEFKELAEKEFQTSPFAPEDADGGWARREFMKLMGASLALTTFGCVRKAQKIVPYVKRPNDIIPGIANYYASSFVDGAETLGTVVTTREGRPIKVEGNEDDPASRGAMSARAHAHILSLYDPDRLTGPTKNLLNESKTNRDTVNYPWEKFDAEVIEALRAGGAALLTASVCSPSEKRAIDSFKMRYGVKHYTYDSVNYDKVREAQKLSYGQSVLPRYRFEESKYTLSLGADFLGTYLAPTAQTRQFSNSRKLDDMSKLVVVESIMSLTGANADERFRVQPSHLLNVAMAVAGQLLDKGRTAISLSSSTRDLIKSFTLVDTNFSDENAEKIADELWQNRGKSLVIAGGLPTQMQDELGLQLAVNLLNSMLGNDGKTIDGKNSAFNSGMGSYDELNELITGLNSGKIKTVIINGVNPVYSAPQSSGFVQALRKAKLAVYVGTHNDETALNCDLVAAESHQLEAWGDHESLDGLYSIQQPTIRPLYATRSFGESLLAWSANDSSYYDYVRETWKGIQSRNRTGIAAQSFDSFWTDLLQLGVLDTRGSKANSSHAARSFNASALNNVKNSTYTGLEFTLYETVGLRDGSLANVSWLQEFPDPVSRVCWDNYVCISPKMAHNEHIKEGQVVELSVGEQKIAAPAHIQPGQDDETIALAVGYGRTAAGKVANLVGVNAFALAQVQEGRALSSGLPVKLSKTKKMIPLASGQGHHTMEGRQIVVEATLDQYKKDPAANIHKHKVFSSWDKHEYKGFKWGMSIDLSSCTGCGSCVIACQSENNIPVVGKNYFLQGREMHWIRIDRYYVGEPSDPGVVYQPVTCMHCDNAPCETVCPVAATTHSDEGTNDMIYNRCVGTRYCANNCPYKVRRFNWFNFTKVESPLHMAMNPEVTVRARGVMEKCTFCVHRIKTAKLTAKADKREFKATDVKTACQQSCPAQAITFGDMNDPESDVSKEHKAGNSYALLEELAVYPALKYRTKIRNTDKLKASHGHGKGGH